MTWQKQKHHHHTPVLLEEVLTYLNPKPTDEFLDLTVGYGGHARAIIDRLAAASQAVLVDRDHTALDHISDLVERGAETIHGDFFTVVRDLHNNKRSFDMVLMDLGVSSPQLDNQARGFSWRFEAPLDMRMDQGQSLTAKQLINDSSQAELEKILQQYGEEPRAKAIAASIVNARPITTTQELAEIVLKIYRYRKKIHPATRTFQAIRIAVNNELDQISGTLELLADLMNPAGRLVIISFHSLEDRIIKQFFQEESRSGYLSRFKLLTKKAVLGKNELVNNPRSRSAKLRAAEKK